MLQVSGNGRITKINVKKNFATGTIYTARKKEVDGQEVWENHFIGCKLVGEAFAMLTSTNMKDKDKIEIESAILEQNGQYMNLVIFKAHPVVEEQKKTGKHTYTGKK